MAKSEGVTKETVVSDKKDSVLVSDQQDKKQDNVSHSDVSFNQQESGGFEVTQNKTVGPQTSETTNIISLDAVSENKQDSASMDVSKAEDIVVESDLINKPTDTDELDKEDKVSPSPVTEPEPVTMESTSSNLTSDVTAD